MVELVKRLASKTGEVTKSLGTPFRYLAVAGIVALAGLLLFWVFDKIVVYYLARSYVDQVALVLNLNPHLASAISWIVFAALVVLVGLIFSLSRTKRQIGIGGVLVLLVSQSLVLWQATRTQSFDSTGAAIKCYVVTRDAIKFGERPGIDPATGLECRPVTPDIAERVERYANGNRPNRIHSGEPVFFDLRTGNPVVWYSRARDGGVEIFDLMGFHPETGEELQPVTKAIVDAWKNQRQLASRRPPQRVHPKPGHTFFDPVTGVASVWYRRSESGDYEFYDRSGFNPQTGEPLLAINREVIADWMKREAEQAATKCYVITRDTVRYGNQPGIDPVTGRQCRPLSAELLERLREYEKGNRPKRIETARPEFFDQRNGEPIVWYQTRKGGEIEIFDLMGFHPETGEELQPVTGKVVDNWKEQQAQKQKRQAEAVRRAPQKIDDPLSYVFFDQVSGEPRGWYWRSHKDDYEFYDAPGFHPRTGDPLVVVTRELIIQRLREAEAAEVKRKEEADRAERERQERVAKMQEEKRLATEREERQRRERAAELEKQSLAAQQCDELAANPNDRNKAGPGVPYDVLKSQTQDAVARCELATKQEPNELRFQYQLARALQLTDRARAFQLHQRLVQLNYPAAFDNLGWLYYSERKNPVEATKLFRLGAQAGDPDSMVSLAEMIDRGHTQPLNPNETKIALYSRAGQLGHARAAAAAQEEIEKEEQAATQNAQMQEQQRRMIQIFGNILQKLPRR